MSHKLQERTLKQNQLKSSSSQIPEETLETSPDSNHPASNLVRPARTNPANLTPAAILTLQQTIGNKAVQRLIKNITPQPSGKSLNQPTKSVSAATIQRAMGMEIELPIPVVTQADEDIAGDTKLFNSPTYKVVTDHSQRAGTMPDGNSAPCLEIVMKHFDEHQPNGLNELNTRLNNIDNFITAVRNRTTNYTVPTTAQLVANTAAINTLIPTTRINPPNPPVNRPPGNFEDGSVHFTVGVALEKMRGSTAWVHNNNPRATNQQRETADHARESHELRANIFNFLERKPSFQHLTDEQKQRLVGYLQLVYIQVRAVEQWNGASLKKNMPQALSRVPLWDIYTNLDAGIKVSINLNRRGLRNLLTANFVEGWKDWNVGHNHGDNITVPDYLNSAFGLGRRITQAEIFGGMKEVGTEEVGSPGHRLTGVPMELRKLGTQHMTAAQWRAMAINLYNQSRNLHP